jgi:Leucine-rich repeat (LRR) protein
MKIVGCILEVLELPDDVEFTKQLYTCIVENIQNEVDINVTDIKRKHVDGKCDADVTAIIFKSVKLENFPRGLSFFFPNLKFFDINKCGLKTISKTDLIGLENIESLIIINNELTTLPDDLLTNMPKLKVIYFSYNKLERVSSKLLQPILKNQPTDICFGQNSKNVNFRFDINSFGSIKQLMDALDKKTGGEIINESLEESSTLDRLTDLLIKAGTKEFRVHKAMFEYRSKYFLNFFAMSTKNEIKFESSYEEILDLFRCFIYTGKLNFDNIEESKVIKLFTFATEYKISALKVMCVPIILKSVNVTNAHEIFKLGDRFGVENFKQTALKKIQEMFPEKILPESLMKQPELLRKLIEGKLSLKRKMQEIDECKEKMKQLKKAENELNESISKMCEATGE